MMSTSDVDGYGRINYADEYFNETPIAVGYSIDWGNPKMRGLVAHVILSHYLGKPPADDAVEGFVKEYGDRLEAGQEWMISEDEVHTFAVAI